MEGKANMKSLVEVKNLSVEVRSDKAEPFTIVKDVSFAIPQGDVLALIGESGSGKTTIALSLLGYARAGCFFSGGEVLVDNNDMQRLSDAELRNSRGSEITYVAQSAGASFNPSKRIIDQVIEPALLHGLLDQKVAKEKAVEMFKGLALPEPESIGNRYPHEVSGGQLQRLLAAMALITNPKLVIFDEPTTALDVTTQIEVLRVFKKVVCEQGATAVYVSHDLAVVAQMADHVVVLQNGEVREAGTISKILNHSEHAYTQSLLTAAKPRTEVVKSVDVSDQENYLLELKGVFAGYGPQKSNGMPEKLVLNDIGFKIRKGTTYGIIGESGSGKSTIARVIAGLLPQARGEVLFKGEALPPSLKLRTKDQFRRIQIVFQNPDTALNPAHTVEQILARPLKFYHGMTGQVQRNRIMELLDQICLPASICSRRSGELSGGQKQRINLARALAAEPDLILCDEITSALDTVVGAAILDLLADLRKELNVSYMFISHYISTVRSICDDTMVLYSGQKVETGNQSSFSELPFHPYTDMLISSVPEMRQGWLEQTRTRQKTAIITPQKGAMGLCSFLNVCPVSQEGLCNVKPPEVVCMSGGSEIYCHLPENILRDIQMKSLAQEGATK